MTTFTGGMKAATMSLREGDACWTGAVEIGDPSLFYRLQTSTRLAITMGGHRWVVIVDGKRLSRSGTGMPQATITVVSPAASLSSPRASAMTRTWDNPITAYAAAVEVAGEELQWDLPDWLITGGRLAVYQADPMELVRTIAGAAGGVLESSLEGVLRVRPRWPLSPPQWDDGPVDHVLTDTAHILQVEEAYTTTANVNRVVVRSDLPSESNGSASLEIDTREDGPNRGQTSWYRGAPVYMRAIVDPGVSVTNIQASMGEVYPAGDQFFTFTDDVTFANTREGTLQQPCAAITGYQWLGASLGLLTLQPNGRTLVADNVGVAVARVTYRVTSQSYRLSAPAGSTDITVLVVAQTTTSSPPGDEVVCRRGAGDRPGDDIVEPLACSLPIKLARGRAALDDATPMQEVRLRVAYNGLILPGHLVEIRDAWQGVSWRGKVRSVSYEFRGVSMVNNLEVVRRVSE